MVKLVTAIRYVPDSTTRLCILPIFRGVQLLLSHLITPGLRFRHALRGTEGAELETECGMQGCGESQRGDCAWWSVSWLRDSASEHVIGRGVPREPFTPGERRLLRFGEKSFGLQRGGTWGSAVLILGCVGGGFCAMPRQ